MIYKKKLSNLIEKCAPYWKSRDARLPARPGEKKRDFEGHGRFRPKQGISSNFDAICLNLRKFDRIYRYYDKLGEMAGFRTILCCIAI